MTNKNSRYYLESLRQLKAGGYPDQEIKTLLGEMEEWLSQQPDQHSPAAQRDNTEPHAIITDQLFREIVDDANIGIVVFAADKAIYSNDRIIDLFRFYNIDRHNLTYSDFCAYATERTKSVMQEREKLMELGIEDLASFVGEFSLPDESKMFLEIHSKPFHSGQGLWRICFMLDVTEKLEARIELDQKIHRYKSIISGTDAGTWEWNLRDNTGRYNEKWGEMFGYTPEEIKQFGNEAWDILVHPEDAKFVTKVIADLVFGKTIAMQFEARVRHKTGRWVWVLSRGRITDWTEDGVPLMLSGANIDITDKKVAEEKLVLAKEELEKSVKALSVASQAKEDFLSIMSHEIRTPLNAVIGLTNLLLRRNPRPDQLEIVKVLKNSSDNLLHLVNDILDYNKIQAGKLQLESVRFNFREFLEHMYSTFKLDAHDRGIDLQVKADSQIPDVLDGDITRLNQILINLLSNSLKFTKKGKVSLDASLISKENGICTLKFVVTDTGIGIHPSKIPKIFEPFHQSEASTTREYGGTGLGLSIIKALVKMFDGSIEVTSLPGKGSSFAVELKLREGSSMPSDAWNGGWELPFGQKKVKVLYVEDVESNRFLVHNLMAEFNLDCTLASSGAEALELTMHTKFDIILMDIQMPGMDGYQTAVKIQQQRGKNRATPIVAFTAEPLTEKLKAKLSKHNLRDVITKPFDVNQFMEKISRLSGGTDQGGEYSLAFYERAASGEMASRIYAIIADEIEGFTASLITGYNENDLARMKAEIHKLSPVIKNLKMFTVVQLLEQLRSFDTIDPSMAEVISNITTLVEPVVADLRAMERKPAARS